MEVLTKENLVEAKNRFHCNFQDCHSLSKGKQVSFVRIHFSHPESDGKSAYLWDGGGKMILNIEDPGSRKT